MCNEGGESRAEPGLIHCKGGVGMPVCQVGFCGVVGGLGAV